MKTFVLIQIDFEIGFTALRGIPTNKEIVIALVKHFVSYKGNFNIKQK